MEKPVHCQTWCFAAHALCIFDSFFFVLWLLLLNATAIQGHISKSPKSFDCLSIIKFPLFGDPFCSTSSTLPAVLLLPQKKSLQLYFIPFHFTQIWKMVSNCKRENESCLSLRVCVCLWQICCHISLDAQRTNKRTNLQSSVHVTQQQAFLHRTTTATTSLAMKESKTVAQLQVIRLGHPSFFHVLLLFGIVCRRRRRHRPHAPIIFKSNRPFLHLVIAIFSYKYRREI